jgi:hypothetical protein
MYYPEYLGINGNIILKCASKYSVDKCGLHSCSSGQWQALGNAVATQRNVTGLADFSRNPLINSGPLRSALKYAHSSLIFLIWRNIHKKKSNEYDTKYSK